MALTNDTSRAISDNLNAGDINANIEVSRSERVRKLSPEAAILFDNSIVARPLNTPEVCSIHVKNTEYYYRWVAALALGGRVYMERKAMGFTNATEDDVTVLVGDAICDKGEIRAGDLILMKLPYSKWAAHTKANMMRAKLLGDMRGVFMKGTPSTDVFSDESPKRASVSSEPFDRSKVSTFIPENPDAFINESVSSGRVDKTREVMSNIREKIDSEKAR